MPTINECPGSAERGFVGVDSQTETYDLWDHVICRAEHCFFELIYRRQEEYSNETPDIGRSFRWMRRVDERTGVVRVRMLGV